MMPDQCNIEKKNLFLLKIKSILTGITFFAAFTITDIIIQFFGITYKCKKTNALSKFKSLI